MKDSKLHILAKSFPNEPGVYQFFDIDNKIIYIGKAKDLKKRVSSYFTKNHESKKTRMLVSNIWKIEKIVVDSEMDALLLENNLIKKYQPKYAFLYDHEKLSNFDYKIGETKFLNLDELKSFLSSSKSHLSLLCESRVKH